MANSIKLFSFNRYIRGFYTSELKQNDPSITLRNWIFMIGDVPFFLSTAAFFMFEAKSMLEYGISFLAASMAAFEFWMYLATFWLIKNTWPFIENCERFIEKRESSIIAYREFNEKIERLSKWITIALMTTFLLMTIPLLFYSLINYYYLDLGKESFYLCFPATWPFDWKTPLGYFVAWFFQTVGIFVCGVIPIMILNFFLGSCWLFTIMAEDITKDLVDFNKDVEANKNSAEWKKRFCDIIQFYSDAKECVNEFNAIFKYVIFLWISLLMVAETSILLTLEFQLMDHNAVLFETFLICIFGGWDLVVLFFLCEPGEQVIYHFDMVCEELQRCAWHTLSIDMQKMYLIFLSDTQQPKKIACYANFQLTRDTFKRILNTGWSYFTTIRQFEI